MGDIPSLDRLQAQPIWEISVKESEPLLVLSLYFLAGLSPRLVADWIAAASQRVLTGSSAQATGIRVLPLGLVRGITPAIADRLSEEGIEDVIGLSMADPIRLIRNTSFDLRQIVGWIDEALLIATLPQQWQGLENEGITGAMDFSWYWWWESDTAVGQPKASFSKLEQRVNMKASTLEEVAYRMWFDKQVNLIWTLYESGGGDDDDKTYKAIPPSLPLDANKSIEPDSGLPPTST